MASINRDLVAFDALVTLLNRDEASEPVEPERLAVDIYNDMRKNGKSFAATCKRLIKAEERDIEAASKAEEREAAKAARIAEKAAAKVDGAAAREIAKAAKVAARENEKRLAKAAKLREAAAKLEALTGASEAS